MFDLLINGGEVILADEPTGVLDTAATIVVMDLLLRLNVEARGSEALMRAKTQELLGLLSAQGAVAADH